MQRRAVPLRAGEAEAVSAPAVALPKSEARKVPAAPAARSSAVDETAERLFFHAFSVDSMQLQAVRNEQTLVLLRTTVARHLLAMRSAAALIPGGSAWRGLTAAALDRLLDAIVDAAADVAELLLPPAPMPAAATLTARAAMSIDELGQAQDRAKAVSKRLQSALLDLVAAVLVDERKLEGAQFATSTEAAFHLRYVYMGHVGRVAQLGALDAATRDRQAYLQTYPDLDFKRNPVSIDERMAAFERDHVLAHPLMSEEARAQRAPLLNGPYMAQNLDWNCPAAFYRAARIGANEVLTPGASNASLRVEPDALGEAQALLVDLAHTLTLPPDHALDAPELGHRLSLPALTAAVGLRTPALAAAALGLLPWALYAPYRQQQETPPLYSTDPYVQRLTLDRRRLQDAKSGPLAYAAAPPPPPTISRDAYKPTASDRLLAAASALPESAAATPVDLWTQLPAYWVADHLIEGVVARWRKLPGSEEPASLGALLQALDPTSDGAGRPYDMLGGLLRIFAQLPTMAALSQAPEGGHVETAAELAAAYPGLTRAQATTMVEREAGARRRFVRSTLQVLLVQESVAAVLGHLAGGAAAQTCAWPAPAEAHRFLFLRAYERIAVDSEATLAEPVRRFRAEVGGIFQASGAGLFDAAGGAGTQLHAVVVNPDTIALDAAHAVGRAGIYAELLQRYAERWMAREREQEAAARLQCPASAFQRVASMLRGWWNGGPKNTDAVPVRAVAQEVVLLGTLLRDSLADSLGHLTVGVANWIALPIAFGLPVEHSDALRSFVQQSTAAGGVGAPALHTLMAAAAAAANSQRLGAPELDGLQGANLSALAFLTTEEGRELAAELARDTKGRRVLAAWLQGLRRVAEQYELRDFSFFGEDGKERRVPDRLVMRAEAGAARGGLGVLADYAVEEKPGAPSVGLRDAVMRDLVFMVPPVASENAFALKYGLRQYKA